jgi:DNA-binding transcriptional LysR family regulator
VGAPLLLRNTRSVRLTELGQTFLRDCTELVGRTNDVVDQMREVGTSPVGRLRVHALPGFVLGHLAKVLRDYQQKYPQVILDMLVNDAAVDPVKEGFDCALQIFPPHSEELVSRKLFPVRRVFCASPEYLRRNGTVRGPRDLLGHRIGWYSGYPTRERLSFHGPKDIVQLDLKPVLLTNSVHLLSDYALEDAGIVCIPTLVAADAVVAKKLKIVLPEYQLSAFWLSIFYPTSQRNSLKLKLFLEMITQSFNKTPPWDERLIAMGLLQPNIVE